MGMQEMPEEDLTIWWEGTRGGRYWLFDPDIDTDNFLLLKIDTDINNW